MSDLQVNYLAVGAAAFAAIIIGALWYSQLLFGDSWLQSHGYTLEQVQATAGRNFAVSLVCYVVMASVLAVIVSYAGLATIRQGVVLGLLVWLGFLATLGLTSHLVSDKPFLIYLIDAGYQLVYVVVMSVILVAWK